ncbi:type II toxin-antitoxin system RelE/ParE family toxin [Candidatus Roizmanbacteria bacterium]|nr:type II toxin-antitoxin system RelE/ParE family toxin [Candidatus Roizmanbacteria bacterium]
MKITLSPLAEKKLRKLPKIDQIAIAQKIRSLKEEKNLLTAEKLQGYKDIYRIRIGNYRIVYRKFSDLFYIILIGHRKDIYEVLQRLLRS